MKNFVLSEAVVTGDKFPWALVLCIAVVLISAACIVFLNLTRRK